VSKGFKVTKGSQGVSDWCCDGFVVTETENKRLLENIFEISKFFLAFMGRFT